VNWSMVISYICLFIAYIMFFVCRVLVKNERRAGTWL
jgi:ABC-type sulfate transport system permease component